MFKSPMKLSIRTFSEQVNKFINPYNDDLSLSDCPDFVTLKQVAFEKLIRYGFSVEQTSPNNANCIIRLFSNKRHMQNNLAATHLIYGFYYYTKNLNTWLTQTANKENLKIDFSKCEFRVWYFQDQYADYECDFVDCYVKVR